MSEDRTGTESERIRENCDYSLKFVKDKSCESSVLMKSNENLKCVDGVEKHVTKELKKKTETSNVWFKKNELKKHAKKARGHSRKHKRVQLNKERKVMMIIVKVVTMIAEEAMKVVKNKMRKA